MTVALTAPPKVTTRRPPQVVVAAVLLLFLGVSALPSGLAMILGIGVDSFPSDWLDYLPLIESWVVPGLVLSIGFGLGSLLAAYGVLRRPEWRWTGFVQGWTGHHWSFLATILIGLGLVVWIGLELIYLPGVHWLQIMYGLLGLAILLCPLLAARKSSGW